LGTRGLRMHTALLMAEVQTSLICDCGDADSAAGYPDKRRTFAILPAKPENADASNQPMSRLQDHSIDSNKAPGNLHMMEFFDKIFLWRRRLLDGICLCHISG
jgi:hypothetical protein